MVVDVDHGEQDAEVVGLREGFDAAVDVLRVQAVVFQAEEEAAGGEAEGVVGGDVGVFPGEGREGFEDGVAFLAGGDEDGGRGAAGGEGLGGGLGDFGEGGGGGLGDPWGRGGGGGRGGFEGEGGGGEGGVVEGVVVHGGRVRWGSVGLLCSAPDAKLLLGRLPGSYL